MNIIPENSSTPLEPSASYLPFRDYVGFLVELFELWWEDYRDRIRICEFDELLKGVGGRVAAQCYFAGDCMGQYLTIEPNGEIAACDKFVGIPEFRFRSPNHEALGRYEVDPEVTDEERARWNVPPLAKSRERAEIMNKR